MSRGKCPECGDAFTGGLYDFVWGRMAGLFPVPGHRPSSWFVPVTSAGYCPGGGSAVKPEAS